MALKYLGFKPPMITPRANNAGKCLKCNHFYETDSMPECGACVSCSFEHFRGALLETAEVLKDYDTINGELFEEKYPMLCDDEHTSTELLTNLLRVSAGETK